MANSFVKNVTTAGTQVRLSATDLFVSAVTIRAKKGNTNDVYIGDADVANSYPDLDANQTVTFEAPIISGSHTAINLKEVWVDADTDGEGVDVWYQEIG
jgi:cold shock CspA family protein